MILVTDIVNCLGNDVLVALDEKRSVIPVRVMADRQQGLPFLKYLNTEVSEVSLFDMPSLDKAFQDIDRLLICNSNFLQDYRSAYTNLIRCAQESKVGHIMFVSSVSHSGISSRHGM